MPQSITIRTIGDFLDYEHRLRQPGLQRGRASADARVTKVDHKTVATVRDELEGCGEIPHMNERLDSKGVSRPVRKQSAADGGDGLQVFVTCGVTNRLLMILGKTSK